MMAFQGVGNALDDSSAKNHPVIDRFTLKERFDISEGFGFASESPLTELPAYFKPWNDVALNLQELVKQKRLRNEVEKLPLLDHNKLSSKAEWEAAHMFLAYITQGYVWQDGEEGIPKVLPKSIAVPFHAAGQYLGIPANFTHFDGGLVNWKLVDSKKPIYLENLETILTLAGGRGEQWFFLISMMVEKECGAALYAIADAQKAVSVQNDIKLKESLMVIEGAVLKMVKQLKRMGDVLTPDVFYNVVRLFLSGWSAPAFKMKGLEGLIFEGVSDKPIAYHHGTGAESSALPALDAALGINHEDSKERLLKDFEKYMPPKHVAFITAVAKGPSIRKYGLPLSPDIGLLHVGKGQIWCQHTTGVWKPSRYSGTHIYNLQQDVLTPDVFYNVVRLFLSGWSAPAFKRKGLEGLIFEGVSDKPIAYHHGTGAESSALPALDAALGINHEDSKERLLKDFEKYMPPKHVAFITAVAKGPSIRKYVTCREGPDLVSAYNRCLEAVKIFRNTHLQLATRFIVVPSRKDTNCTEDGLVDKGGTGFMDFLKGLRDSTVDAFLRQRSITTTPSSSVWRNMTIAAILGVTGIIMAALVRRIR